DGRPLPDPPAVDGPNPSFDGDQSGIHGLGHEGSRYEVMFFLNAPDDSIEGFKEVWSELGDSIVVVGGDGVWNCHVHTDDIGAAIEAGIDVGRPHRIRVTDLIQEVEEQAWVRDQLVELDKVVPCAVVAVANGTGIRDIFRSLGVQWVVVGGQSMNPSTADILAAVEAVPSDQVVVLP
ncbi:MAG TPA: Dak phosphatase, partial [Acidimicrobiaceae bacterium]|nr:Dak phosphatase [Acidimicrobiaceae bacterium]